MLNTLKYYLERRSQLQRHAKFLKDIARYRTEVLVPEGFGEFEINPLVEKRRRSVFMGEQYVWKFYRTGRGDARNTIAAASVLKNEGIRAPRILFSDVSEATKEDYRICCVVMNRLEGPRFESDASLEEILEIVRFLARIHSIRSHQWGECSDLKTEGYLEEYFLRRARSRLKLIGKWCADTGGRKTPEVMAWFQDHRDDVMPFEDQFCLISADAHPRNFLRSPDGNLCIIDLDRTRYLDFPVDVLSLIPVSDPLRAAGKNASGEELIQSIENHSSEILKVYFESVPSGFREHWIKTRTAHLLLQLVVKLHGELRRREAKFSMFKPLDIKKDDAEAHFILDVIEKLLAINSSVSHR